MTALGVTKANVYYYFRTKIEILEPLLDGTVTGLTASTRSSRHTGRSRR